MRDSESSKFYDFLYARRRTIKFPTGAGDISGCLSVGHIMPERLFIWPILVPRVSPTPPTQPKPQRDPHHRSVSNRHHKPPRSTFSTSLPKSTAAVQVFHPVLYSTWGKSTIRCSCATSNLRHVAAGNFFVTSARHRPPKYKCRIAALNSAISNQRPQYQLHWRLVI